MTASQPPDTADPPPAPVVAPLPSAPLPAAPLASAPLPSAPVPTAPRPLWRNLRFQALWIGMTSSTLGVAVADVAYPLVILTMTGSPARAGLFAAVQAIAMLAAGLPAGSLADRFDPRAIVLVTEAGRAAVTAAVVVALAAGWLSLPLLLAAGALLGLGQAACDTARTLLLRSVVANEQLTTALAQDQVRTNGAAMAGPAVGGALYAVRALAHAAPFVFTAASFALALATTALLPRPERRQTGPGDRQGRTGPGDRRRQTGPAARQGQTGPDDRQPGDQGAAADPAPGGMLAGVRVLWGHPVLRAAMILIMVVNTLGAGLDLIVIVLLRHQTVPSTEIGLALGAGYAGGIAGIPVIRIVHRLRPGVMLLAVCLVVVPVLALLAVPLGPWWAAALLFVALLGIPSVQVAMDILVIRQAPAEQRGRVVAAFMTLIGLGVPIGLAGCGLLLQYVPAQAAMLALAAVLAVAVAYSATRRELWHARWPAR
jgi:MFS family permease